MDIIRRLIERIRPPVVDRSLPRQITLSITNDDIANGTPGNTRRCAAALAIARLFPDRKTFAGLSGVWVQSDNGWTCYGTPALLTFIKRFDDGEYVVPTTFVLPAGEVRDVTFD